MAEHAWHSINLTNLIYSKEQAFNESKMRREIHPDDQDIHAAPSNQSIGHWPHTSKKRYQAQQWQFQTGIEHDTNTFKYLSIPEYVLF